MNSNSYDRKWTLRHLPFHTWLKPATATRQFAKFPLFPAWVYHIVVLFITCVTLGIMDLAATAISRNYVHHSLATCLQVSFKEFLLLCHQELGELFTSPDKYMLSVLEIAIHVELLFAGLVVLAMPFGARRERTRDSLAHAFRRLCLHSSAVLPAIILIGTLNFSAEQIHDQWQEELRQEYDIKNPPPVELDTDDPEVLKAQAAALTTHREKKWRFVISQCSPWYKAYAIELAACASVPIVGYFVWTLVSGLIAYRVTTPFVRPPTCRRCGYNLTGQKLDSRCPECGSDIYHSLHPLGSPGVSWDRRSVIGFGKAYLKTMVESIRTPTLMAQRLSVNKHMGDAAMFLAINAGFICLLILGTLLATFHIGSHESGTVDPFLSEIALFATGFLTSVVICAVSLSALISALIIRKTDGVNMLNGTAQLASYCSSYLVAWAIICSLLTLSFVYDYQHLHMIELFLGDMGEIASGVIVYGIILVTPFLYFIRVIKASKGVRYAN